MFSGGKPNMKLKPNLKNILLILLIVVLVAILLYNLVPLLIYLVKKYLFPKKMRAKRVDPKSETSPWIRISSHFRKDKILVDECSTVDELFSKATNKFKDKHCFGCRQVLDEEDERQSDGRVFKKVVLSDYKWFTSGEIEQKVELISKGFLSVGIKPKEKVIILAETRLEWMISCQSLLRIGSIVSTLYTTLGEDGIIHGINETQVSHLITNYELLPKLKQILNKLTKLEVIIYINGLKDDINKIFDEKQRQRVSILSLKQIEEYGITKGSTLEGIKPTENDIAVVMYTSGSTGVPKGVMISHKNFLCAVRAFYTFSPPLNEKDIYCAYLPLAHIMEMSAQLFFIAMGATVGYATIQTLTDKSTAIKKGIRGDAPLLKPTAMAAVPLILDRIRIAITEEIAKRGRLSIFVVNILDTLKIFWFRRGFDCPLINRIFCHKFQMILGGKIRLIPVGGAPLSPETHDFIRSYFNTLVLQGYGLTETASSGAIMDVDDVGTGFVGSPLEGIQISLVNWDEGNYRITDKPNPRGEIVIGGNNVTIGYFKRDDLTKESYKEENGIKWFLTGDIGEIYSNGSLRIIDRKKDIIKLSTGEYMSLGKIEAELKKNPIVSNVCVYGNPLKDYLIAFIIPNTKQLQTLAQNLSKDKMDFKELCSDSEINKKVLKSIKETAQTSKLLKLETPTKIKLCSEEWLPDNGLVTAALKLRRKNIEDFYRKDINQMYGFPSTQ